MLSSSARCVSVVMILESQENGPNPIPVGYSLQWKPNPESSAYPWTSLPESPTPNPTLRGKDARKTKALLEQKTQAQSCGPGTLSRALLS